MRGMTLAYSPKTIGATFLLGSRNTPSVPWGRGFPRLPCQASVLEAWCRYLDLVGSEAHGSSAIAGSLFNEMSRGALHRGLSVARPAFGHRRKFAISLGGCP